MRDADRNQRTRNGPPVFGLLKVEFKALNDAVERYSSSNRTLQDRCPVSISLARQRLGFVRSFTTKGADLAVSYVAMLVTWLFYTC